MADVNRKNELDKLLAAIQEPSQSAPINELIEYLRLVSLAHGPTAIGLCICESFIPRLPLRYKRVGMILDSNPVPNKFFALQVRDLHVRDSENVTTFGGGNLQQLAKSLSEEECKL